ncbi:MAG TPA: heparan-alpha-glucosaminide N-acetyltransferase domain-containing protein [Mucilaginibacter sp.]|jgi:predicted acyltransferase
MRAPFPIKTSIPTRFESLDVLRGLTVAFMVIVNSPGSNVGYTQLEHAPWNGFTLTDLVFPTFLFVMGNAMSFTIRKYNKENQRSFLTKVFKRTLIIYLIGIFLNAYPFFRFVNGHYEWIDFTAIRLVHVLGRIAICYCVVSLIIYYSGPITAYVFSAVAILVYWWILYHFGDQPDPYSLTGNAVSKFDLFVLGTKHIWHGEGVPFDPEGLLSTLPAIANVTAGYFAGQYIQRAGISKPGILRLAMAGVLLALIAAGWAHVFPINKKIWTSSYVLLTVGLDLLILAILVFVIEIAKMRRGAKFFLVFGRNPLILYILSYLIVKLLYYLQVDGVNARDWIYKSVFLPLIDPVNASLLFSLTVMMIVWIVGYFMNKNKLYVKV